MTDPTETARALLRDAENYLSALHGSVARHDNLAANLGCAGCELRDRLAAALRAPAVVSAAAPSTDQAAATLDERMRAAIRDALRTVAQNPTAGTDVAASFVASAALAEVHRQPVGEAPADRSFVPPAAENLPHGSLDSATDGATMLDAWAETPQGRNFLAHALVQLARDGWLRPEPGEGFEPVRDRADIPQPQDPEELRRLAGEAPATNPHSCGNCEGIDPDTCFMNPDRPPEQCPAAEFEDYGQQCQKPVGHELHTFEEQPAVVEPAEAATETRTPVHAIPLPGSNGISSCCGRPPCEFVGERVTRDPDEVTCTGHATEAQQDGAQT